MSGDAKSSVMRFLFDVTFNQNVTDKITQSGIMFIRAEDITENLNESALIDANLSSDNATTIKGGR